MWAGAEREREREREREASNVGCCCVDVGGCAYRHKEQNILWREVRGVDTVEQARGEQPLLDGLSVQVHVGAGEGGGRRLCRAKQRTQACQTSERRLVLHWSMGWGLGGISRGLGCISHAPR